MNFASTPPDFINHDPSSAIPRRPRAKSDARKTGTLPRQNSINDTRPTSSSSTMHDSKRDSDRGITDMGPTMRIHGKAPWEQDGEFSDDDNLSDSSSTSRVFAKKFRMKPRVSTTSRPSIEINRKPTNDKSPTSLGQGSRSASSLTLQPLGSPVKGPPSPISAVKKSSNLRLHPRHPSNNSGVSSPHTAAFYAAAHSDVSPTSPDGRTGSPNPSEYSQYIDVPKSPSPRQSNDTTATSFGFNHPYANSEYAISPNSPNDTFSRPSSSSTLEHRASTSSGPFKEPSTASRPADPKATSKHLAFPKGPTMPQNWQDKTNSPSIVLISLQEAQAAQQRERMRSFNSSRPSTTESFLDGEEDETIGENARLAAARARARSYTAGAISTNKISPPNSTTPDGKGLKHRKSGFMKLFKDKPSEPIPALPSSGLANISSPVSIPTHSSGRSTPPPPPPPPSAPISRPPPPSVYSAPPPPRPSDSLMPPSPRTSRPQVGSTSHLGASSTYGAKSSNFQGLSLRPVSTLFSAHFSEHLVTDNDYSAPAKSRLGVDRSPVLTPSPSASDDSPIDVGIRAAATVNAINSSPDESNVVRDLRAQLSSVKKTYQRQISDLQEHIKSLELELARAHAKEDEHSYCQSCGRGGLLDAPTLLGHGRSN